MFRLLRLFFSFLGDEGSYKAILKCFSRFGKLTDSLIRMLYGRTVPSLERSVFGLNFRSPVGLAAGIDPNAKYCRQFSNIGFGFLEIGSVTPLPQKGNPSPRFFRLPKDRAVISRTGNGNEGVKSVINHLKKTHPSTIIAANITKNNISEGEKVASDFGYCFSMLYDFVDMFVVNISCSFAEGKAPDTSYLSEILDELLEKRMTFDIYKPILVKISPDIGHSQIDDILHFAQLSGIDGIVAGGSTVSRENLVTSRKKLDRIGTGRLSGAPLFNKNLELVRYIHEKTKGRLPIIGCGGIMTPQDACTMLEAGASLIEIGTGLIYQGPSLIRKINKFLTSANA